LENSISEENVRIFDLWQKSECAFFDCTIDEHNELLSKVAMAEANGFFGIYDAIKAAVVSMQN
jgi:hypothetical protein